ncbi:uncharacterized protein L201_002355 [Kwoniella dendrophila CBS 6074]|uniref:BTB domain-containing protein n=1 Tax=Kwoniella dendrophila CBS 6074 TaxID=1295534 RepID=A0AAX4JPY7_9TREE
MATTSYIDKSGTEYQYHMKFDSSENDFIIVSSDNIAFRVSSSKLKSCGSTFGDMLDTCQSEENTNTHLKIDSSSKILSIFLSAITERTINLKGLVWEEFTELMDLCNQFDTYQAGRTILNDNIKPINHFGEQNAYELFALADQFDAFLCVFKIISAIKPYADEHSKLWTEGPWPRKSIENLSVTWVWAYLQGHHQCTIKYSYNEHSNYWRDVAARFLQNISEELDN